MNVPVKKGMLLRHQGRYYWAESVVEHHSGQQKPAIHVSLRDALDGHHLDRTVDQLLPIEEVAHGFRTMQYLYAKGTSRVFMDSETFEESELSPTVLDGLEPFLREGQELRVLFAGGQPLRLEMPETIVLKIADTAAPAHAVGAGGSVLKEARLENGLEVRVPLFLKTGDSIKINTRSREYLGKA